MSSMKRNRDLWSVLGLPFDVVNLTGSIKLVEESIDQNTRLFLSTPNLNFAIAAQSDADFFDSVVDSNLSVADGMPLIWVAKLLGVPITERVAGSTLFEELSRKPRVNKIKVFFFGGQKGVAEQAYQKLNDTGVGMKSCGFYDPGFVSIDEMSSLEIINEINNAKPDFIVVALGAKKGQAWIQKNRGLLTAPVISHLGAVINFVAGSVVRAPVRWQRFGLEWVWRIKQERSLWKRYFFDGLSFIRLLLMRVFPLSIYDRLLKSRSYFNAVSNIEWADSKKGVVRLSGSFHYQKFKPAKEFLSSILDTDRASLILDFSKVVYIDSAFIATLLLFQNELKKRDRCLVLINLSKRMKILMLLNNVNNRFNIR